MTRLVLQRLFVRVLCGIVICVALFLLPVGAVLWLSPPLPIRDHIHPGMTKDQVRSILGRPEFARRSSDGDEILSWRDPDSDGVVEIWFDAKGRSGLRSYTPGRFVKDADAGQVPGKAARRP
jgi:hypothetical protein